MKTETLLLKAIQTATLDQLTALVADYLEQPILIVDQSGKIISQQHAPLTAIPTDWLDPLATDNRYTDGQQQFIRDVLNPQALNPWYLFLAQSPSYPLTQQQVQLVLQVINNFTDRYALNPNQNTANAALAQLLATPETTDTQLLQSLTTERLICVTATATQQAPHQAGLLAALRQLAAPLPLTENQADLVFLLTESQLAQAQPRLAQLGQQFDHYFFLSEPYADIVQTPAFLSICRQASEMAQQLGTRTVVNSTQKYNIYVILNHVDNGALLRNTMCTQLLTLKHYDDQHHAELFHTLFAYLENDCHVSKTATHLHLHRNSLAKRLAKIQALIPVDFTNPDKTFGLRLSYRLFHFLQL
ncbi:helix-turn-helix domain-containing protein [Levilactobacillus angrenensis]|uniref:Helix-turn-helix domain-containing protein n=1 Tax=Levilactobacillus angrenensis TaxID=2486020 RepID=A0ABW1U6X6_9LACO|nr:helix-turn-helix domain-containing protein [Levilactobacillus angrenensis]